jgi:plasmid stability protein
MANLTLRNIPARTYAALEREARQNCRSLNAEILNILADRAELARRRKRAAKVLAKLDRIRFEIARENPNQPDSIDFIREDARAFDAAPED